MPLLPVDSGVDDDVVDIVLATVAEVLDIVVTCVSTGSNTGCI